MASTFSSIVYGRAVYPKPELKLDAWPRELAPSTELRKWYSHDPVRFAEFRRRYKAELAERREPAERTAC